MPVGKHGAHAPQSATGLLAIRGVIGTSPTVQLSKHILLTRIAAFRDEKSLYRMKYRQLLTKLWQRNVTRQYAKYPGNTEEIMQLDSTLSYLGEAIRCTFTR